MSHRAPVRRVQQPASASRASRWSLAAPGGLAAAAFASVVALATGCAPAPHDAMPDPPPPVTLPTPTASPASLSGGTLLVLRDGKTAVASDPDRDAVFVVDLASERLLATLPLESGDQPGRLVQGADDTVFVALRQGGAIVAIDPRAGSIARRQSVCPAPRGLGFDAAGTAPLLHVACAGGELVSLVAATLSETRRVQLDRDLRDVVVSGDHLYVSRFRAAEVLRVRTADLGLIDRTMAPGSLAANRMLIERGPLPPPPVVAPDDPVVPPTTPTSAPTEPPAPGMKAAQPVVAWRMRPLPSGGAIMLHQEASNGELGTDGGGYGGGPCKGPIGAAVVEFHDGPEPPLSSGQLMFSALPIDFDVSPDRKLFAMITAQGDSPIGGGPIVLTTNPTLFSQTDCVVPQPPSDPVIEYRPPAGEPIAVAFDGQGRLVAQTREPARLEILTHRGGSIKLSDVSRADVGHKLFHQITGSGLACASCHPEGGDDGRVWRFTKLGARRTQNLLGGIAMTAPFHWDGDMKDFGQLMQAVFTGRMRGPMVDSTQVSALNRWLDNQPALPLSAPRDPDAVARGKALFNDAKVACATCHSGALLTDNSNRLVGTGSMLQVPSLRGVAARAPYMHDGCAKTLRDRFDTKCGGGDTHGMTSHLGEPALQDLIAYLESL
jgi:YD repeat-containing protein